MKRLALGSCAWLFVAAAACGLDDTVLRDAPDAAALPDGGATDAPIGTFDVAPVLDAHGVFAGQTSTCAIVVGRSYCWGSNVLGGLGTGDLQGRLSPTAVAAGVAFRALAPGESHTCGLEASAGRVLCWGSGASGQLGLGDTQPRSAPDVIQGLPPIQQLSAGYVHTCAVTTAGALFCWGANDEGQIGLDDGPPKPNPTSPVQVGTASDWIMVSGGQGHTCGIRKPGSMWCWGRNTAAELGIGEGQPIQLRVPTRVGTFDDYTSVDVGQDNACALRRDGSLWCWGSGEFVGAASPDGGDLWSPTQIGSDTDWTQVSADVFSACAVKSSGALYCWGRNAEGQLGVGDITYRSSPTRVAGATTWSQVSVGRMHTCAESTTRAISCTGIDESGELGLGDTARRNVFTPVAFPATR